VASGRGTLIVIAGPSGVGKGSLVKSLLSRDPQGLSVSISVTTRAPRATEVDGRDYVFVSNAELDRMIARDELLEWAEVFGNRYGTPRDAVQGRLAEGKDVILEIDVQGAMQVRERLPGALLVFIEPPSMPELETRLRGRGTESEERLAVRLATAAWEMDQRERFDEVVVNDDLERASLQVAAIIETARASHGPSSGPTPDAPPNTPPDTPTDTEGHL
jgi:guanylate kinase